MSKELETSDRAIIARRETTFQVLTIFGTLPTDFLHLRDLLIRMRGICEMIQNGRTEFCPDLATLLRSTVADNSFGVVQRCAAHKDITLPLYVSPGREQFSIEISELLKPWTAFDIAVCAFHLPPFTEPIDLDAWLNLAITTESFGEVSHRSLIRIVADTLGAHADPGLHDFIIRHGFRDQGGELNMGVIGTVLLNYAQLVIRLVENNFTSELSEYR
ncbi:MAG: hypothetical protein JNL67_00005 [Planctomycetaceae bacterium]|nr:hypothetical protein [Planctomycetaceae bacterium]